MVTKFNVLALTLILLAGCSQNSSNINQKSAERNIVNPKQKYDLKQPEMNVDMDFKTLPLEQVLKEVLPFSSNIEISIPENYVGIKQQFVSLGSIWTDKSFIDELKKENLTEIPQCGILNIFVNESVFNDGGKLKNLKNGKYADFETEEELKELGYNDVKFYETDSHLPFVVLKGENGVYQLYVGMEMQPMILTVLYVNLEPKEEDSLIWYNIVESVYRSINDVRDTLIEMEEVPSMSDYLDMENDAEAYQPKADEFIKLAEENDLEAVLNIIEPALLDSIGKDNFKNYLTKKVFPFFQEIEEFENYLEVLNEIDPDGNLSYSFVYKAKMKSGVDGYVKVGVAMSGEEYFLNSVYLK